MNERQRDICKLLQGISSEEAATWILNNYKTENDNWGEVFVIFTHRSWKKSDQIRFANYYLKKLPYASGRGYEAFLSFMSITNFISAILEFLPESKSDRSLLSYHLSPILRKNASSDKDQKLICELEKLIS